MSRTNMVLAGLCGWQVFVWLGALLPQAHAEEPQTATSQLRCKIFSAPLDRPTVFESVDRTSEAGQWVGEQVDEGWSFSHVDFEVGQKSTGFAQGWIQVCVSR